MHKKILRAGDRGSMKNDWLTTWHSFSFAEYFNPEYMGFGRLRVLNEDIVAPHSGFQTHPHRDMEIVTYMISGRLHHRDSMGNDYYIRAGEIQQMSAGTGITHSETNDDDEPAHLYQIWIFPRAKGTTPRYETHNYRNKTGDGLILLASGDGQDGSLQIGQDATIWRAALKPGAKTVYRLPPGRHLWIQNVKGELQAAGETLSRSDGLAITGSDRTEEIVLTAAGSDVELLLFDS